MDGIQFEVIQTVALILGPGGAVYLGLKGALNGMRKDIGVVLECANKIEDDVDAMQKDVTTIKAIIERP
jgi:hypothetical protein